MIGWLLDTNVISALINPNGAPLVKTWAGANDENTFFISILTLAEYDKDIENLPPGELNRYRYMDARDTLAERFSGRILSLDDSVVRRWGMLSGRVKRENGQAPPVIDTLLAATAIEYDLYLVTRNIKDMRHSGAAIFDPWNDNAGRFPLSRR